MSLFDHKAIRRLFDLEYIHVVSFLLLFDQVLTLYDHYLIFKLILLDNQDLVLLSLIGLNRINLVRQDDLIGARVKEDYAILLRDHEQLVLS